MTVTAMFSRARAHRDSKLDKMAASLVNEIKDSMDDQVIQAVRIMHTEPPPKASSTYERTHKYSTSWEPIPAHLGKGGLVAGIRGNAVDPRGHNYTVYVGGDETGTGQQPQHAETGWPLAALAIQGLSVGISVQAGDDFVRRIQKAIQRSKR